MVPGKSAVPCGNRRFFGPENCAQSVPVIVHCRKPRGSAWPPDRRCQRSADSYLCKALKISKLEPVKGRSASQLARFAFRFLEDRGALVAILPLGEELFVGDLR